MKQNFVKELRHFDIDDQEINLFANEVLNFMNSKDIRIAENNKARFNDVYDSTDTNSIKQYYQLSGIKMSEFISIPLSYISDWKRFHFLHTIFPKIIPDDVRILVIRGGNLVVPHSDQAIRKYVLNFPIFNFESSKTHFYQFKEAQKINRLLYKTDELELVYSFQYKPKMMYVLDTSNPHSIETLNTNPRIVLSYGIVDKEEYANAIESLNS